MHPALQIFLGALLADFLAAFFHFYEDTYLPNTNDPGPMGEIARTNELHHALPFAMASIPRLSNITVTFPLSLLIATCIVLVAPMWARSHVYLILTMMIVGTLANLVHRWQHERDCTRPALVTALQNAGVLVSREQHKIHHDQPDRMYGVVFAAGNWVYDTFGVWTLLRTIIPLKQYPKPGVSEYTKYVPDSIKQELEKPCPRRLTEREVDSVRDQLAMTVVK